MIVRRLFLYLAAAGALAACAAVCVLALAFALYAEAELYVSRAGAGAIVAGAAALLIAAGVLVLSLAARAKRPRKLPPTAAGMVDRAVALLKERPVTALVAAVATGLLAVRNPRYLGAAVRSFVEGRETPRR